VVDYAGYAAASGAPGDSVHPWAVATLHAYTWVSGGAPARAGQIVLTAPTGYRAGDPITVQTAAGPRRFTVSGVIRTGAQAAFYTTGAEAARLAGGRIDAVALTARPGGPAGALAARVRAVARGRAVRVLTGEHRRAAEPNPGSDLLAVAATLLGLTSGLAGFVSVFVVAGTFAYAVAARRREFGLLRAAGATPRQVRRLVLGEALTVGLAASGAGCALGAVVARPFARWFARAGFAPPGFTAHLILWPLAAAFGAGLVIALTGAWLAARRAGRVRPAEALREASVDRRAMTVSRWVVGLAALVLHAQAPGEKPKPAAEVQPAEVKKTVPEELEALNRASRKLYAGGRARELSAVPAVILVSGDDLILRRGDKRSEVAVIPAEYHSLKCVAHATLALFAHLAHEPG